MSESEQILINICQTTPLPKGAAFASSIRKLAGELSIAPPSKNELLVSYHKLVKNGSIKANNELKNQLVKRNIRTLSGVAPIAVLTKPYLCPGQCSFCPTEVKMPKSYLSNEPAVMRAVLNKWDPYKQVQTRLNSYKANGHNTDKCELIVIGGTWSFLPKQYQTWYIKRLFDGLNGFTSKTLKQAQKYNETAKNRAIGLCLETRPDYITIDEVARMRRLGCTRVEIGLQSTNNEVLKLNKRGHGTQTVKRATQLLRDAGFKISYHMMPNLPGSSPSKDIKSFKELFSDPGYHPDMLKIYPCVVVKSTEIYKWWLQKKYKPYSDEVLFKTLIAIKKHIPYYCRVTRLIRDIPTTSIYAGNMIANLRQNILQSLKDEGNPCKCIRCREPKEAIVTLSQANLLDRNYNTIGGTEHFISYESKIDNKILGFVRLRLPEGLNENLYKKIPELKDCAIVRELHVYGSLVPINSKSGKVQHQGFGKRLMKEAEKVAKKNGYKKLAVISGIGVREYYKKLGYKLEGSYMIKEI